MQCFLVIIFLVVFVSILSFECIIQRRSIRMAKWSELLTLDNKVTGSYSDGGRVQLMMVLCLIAQSLSLSPLHSLSMT